jgi:PhnB protein
VAVNPIPDGYGIVTPILLVDDADALIDFMKRTFDAQVYQLGRRADGQIWHADVTIAGAHLMITAAGGAFPAAAAALNIYVPDVDATYRRALDAGATSIMPRATVSTATGTRSYGIAPGSSGRWRRMSRTSLQRS